LTLFLAGRQSIVLRSATSPVRRRVYVDVARYQQTISDLVKYGTSQEQATKDVRAQAVYVVRHERQHVEQFRGNNDQPPATGQRMIAFEAASYGNDARWLGTAEKFLPRQVQGHDPRRPAAPPRVESPDSGSILHWRTPLPGVERRESCRPPGGSRQSRSAIEMAA
jgi:hypothetical protein